jgi:hypothetical protein
MDVADTFTVCAQALERARSEHQPLLIEARTYRFRGHSMADPEEYRTREQVEEWRARDPIVSFGERLVREGVLGEAELGRLDAEAIERVDRAVDFADASPFPEAHSLYDDVYVLGDQVGGWYSVDARTPTPHRGEDERAMPRDQLPGGGGYEPEHMTSTARPVGAVHGLPDETSDRDGDDADAPGAPDDDEREG